VFQKMLDECADYEIQTLMQEVEEEITGENNYFEVLGT